MDQQTYKAKCLVDKWITITCLSVKKCYMGKIDILTYLKVLSTYSLNQIQFMAKYI